MLKHEGTSSCICPCRHLPLMCVLYPYVSLSMTLTRTLTHKRARLPSSAMAHPDPDFCPQGSPPPISEFGPFRDRCSGVIVLEGCCWEWPPSWFLTPLPPPQSFGRIKKWLEHARSSPSLTILAGGKCDDSVGYFVEPCVIESKDPQEPIMQEVTGRVAGDTGVDSLSPSSALGPCTWFPSRGVNPFHR